MILINRTFEIVTPESAEDGEIAESGFLAENAEYGFRELVRLMRDHRNPSCYPTRGEIHCWLSGDAEPDYRTGDETTNAMHYSPDNPPKNAKYWAWAMRAAGVIK